MGWNWNVSRYLYAAAATTIPVTFAFQKNELKDGKWSNKFTMEERKDKARKLIQKTMIIHGIPGMSVGVSINGKKIWTEGFGYSNIECSAECTGDSVMRIASISKPITATVAARLVDLGVLNIDKDIREYIPDYPKKKFNSKDVSITVRQLLSHSGGIRHYHNPNKKSEVLEDPGNSNTKAEEFLSNKPFKNVTEALEMFKNDDLVAEPGTQFSYTTHGLTLASAVMEKAADKTFPNLVKELLFDLGMRNTYLDSNSTIINNRTGYYRRNEKHVLENCPEVDCSYKWAGGGIISNVSDLLVFANAILYSVQSISNNDALITNLTILKFFEPQISVDSKVCAALGWFLVGGNELKSMKGKKSTGGYFYHTGGAVGASSVLLVRPSENEKQGKPSGNCVAILCNLQDVSLISLGHSIEEIFRE